MSSTLDYFFGPLSPEYCIWFYIIMVIIFIKLAIFLVKSVYDAMFTKKFDFMYALLGALTLFAFYFQNRLLYSMCVSKA
uniref:Uncharacterized protein n=1 Tax=viral metagenome TaxID=1070528 RepID=A0A6C0AT69_9ZZZZ